MRLTDIVVASVVLGAGLGLLTSDQPGAAASEPTARAASVAGDRTPADRITWLRTPLMHRTASAR